MMELETGARSESLASRDPAQLSRRSLLKVGASALGGPMRIDETPRIETYIMPSTAEPGGLGEAATAIVAPAVTNAIFAASGRRVRRLPIETT